MYYKSSTRVGKLDQTATEAGTYSGALYLGFSVIAEVRLVGILRKLQLGM